MLEFHIYCSMPENCVGIPNIDRWSIEPAKRATGNVHSLSDSLVFQMVIYNTYTKIYENLIAIFTYILTVNGQPNALSSLFQYHTSLNTNYNTHLAVQCYTSQKKIYVHSISYFGAWPHTVLPQFVLKDKFHEDLNFCVQ